MAILLLTTVAAFTYDGEPSDSELAGWFNSLTRAEQIAEFRELDRIEHAAPALAAPRLVVIQSEDGTIDAYFDGTLHIDIAGYLQYDVTLPSVTVKGNPQVNRLAWFGAGIGIGLIIAAAAALLL